MLLPARIVSAEVLRSRITSIPYLRLELDVFFTHVDSSQVIYSATGLSSPRCASLGEAFDFSYDLDTGEVVGLVGRMVKFDLRFAEVDGVFYPSVRGFCSFS